MMPNKYTGSVYNGQTKRFTDTVRRVKEFHSLPVYVAKITSWIKKTNGYWYTHCPSCQLGRELPEYKHSFWVNSTTCGCLKPACELHGSFDVISLHAFLNKLTNSQAVLDLAKAMPEMWR